MKYRVTGPYQVVHDGKVYVDGDVVEASSGDASAWVAAGYVVEEKPAKKAEPKAQPAADNDAGRPLHQSDQAVPIERKQSSDLEIPTFIRRQMD